MSHKHKNKNHGHSNYSFLTKFVIALIILVIALFYLNRYQAKDNPVTLSHKHENSLQPASSEFRVSRVIDGDTIVLSNGDHVRYLGIDAPETHILQNGHWIDAPKPFGPEAAEFNRQMVEGKVVRLEYDVERYDKYNRTLAYIYVDDKCVNAELLKEGYACVFNKSPNIKHADEFIALQREARLARRGMWGAVEKITAADTANYIDQVRLVSGKVVGTGASSKMVFLNFGPDKDKDFTVVIYRDALKYFKQKGIDPLSFYTGKTIEVSGRIHAHSGPEIIVGSPGEVDVIE